MVEELEKIEIAIPEPGIRMKAKVVGIKRGKLKELINIDAIRNDAIRERMKKNAERDAIQIEFEVGGAVYNRTMLYSLNPRSNFYKLMKKLGGKLQIGSEIEVIFDDRGRPRIVVE